MRALDAFDNLVDNAAGRQGELRLFLEVAVDPLLDESLSTAAQRPREPPQRYMLQLMGGVASQRVPTQVAGELTIRMAQPSHPTVEHGGAARIKVVAGKATSVDVLNIPEAGQAGQAFELVCLARDRFGNVDETFEKEVTIDYDGQLPNGDRLTLPNDGVVTLKKGLAKVRVGRGRP